MLCSARPVKPLTALTAVRSAYTPPGSRSSVLTRRLPRRLKVGETRPPIYYKFDCTVQLSDGSIVTRRSQYPRIEIKLLADQRNNPRWNPSRPNLKAIEADSTGRLAKFRQKYGFEPEKAEVKTEVKTEVKPDTEVTSPTKPKENMVDVFTDLMGENITAVPTGGKVARRRKK